MNPKTREGQERVYKTGVSWWGDVWKTWVKMKSMRADLKMSIIDTDCGLGLIEEGTQEIISCPEDLDFEYWDKNRQKYIISVEEFKKQYL